MDLDSTILGLALALPIKSYPHFIDVVLATFLLPVLYVLIYVCMGVHQTHPKHLTYKVVKFIHL
jgi:hypothetical protein